MTKEKLIKEYTDLFNRYQNLPGFENVMKRGFLFHFDEMEQTDILFIGINPSFDGKSDSINSFYSKDQNLIELPYFKAFYSIEEKLGEHYKLKNLKWTHLDLLVFRETNQKSINKLFHKQGFEFLLTQLEIAKKRIEILNPKVVVVSNALARTFLGKDKDGEKLVWLGLPFVFDKNLGFDKIDNSEININSAFFFSSMLSGQRALDKGSEERLVWQIAQVLKK